MPVSARFQKARPMRIFSRHNARRAGALAALFAGGFALGCGTSTNQATSGSGGATTNASAGTALSRPVLGYAWDNTANTLRPLYGVTGAAITGAALFPNGAFTTAAVSTRKQYALLVDSSGQLQLATLPGGAPVPLATPGLPGTEHIAISPGGTTALLYTAAAPTAILIQGLPSSPTFQSIHLPAGVTTAQAAVSDDGLVLLSTSASATSAATIQLLRSNGSAATLTTLRGFGSMSFVPHGERALLADSGQATLLLASALTGTPVFTTLASGTAQGIQQPVAVAASADGRWALVANAGSGSSLNILRLDLSGQAAPLQLACNCTPSMLQPLAGNGVFLLTSPGTGALSIFDGDASTPRTVFAAAPLATGSNAQ